VISPLPFIIRSGPVWQCIKTYANLNLKDRGYRIYLMVLTQVKIFWGGSLVCKPFLML